MPTFITLECENCAKIFQREQRQLTSSKLHEVKHYFCGRSCGVSWNNRNKHPTGGKSSILERWIVERLKERYPYLIFENGRKDLLDVGGELDIFVPAMNFALEIHGKSHYLPIWGEDVLRKTIANDALKAAACKRAGIELVVVDVSSLEGVKDPKFEKILISVFGLFADRGIF